MSCKVIEYKYAGARGFGHFSVVDKDYAILASFEYVPLLKGPEDLLRRAAEIRAREFAKNY